MLIKSSIFYRNYLLYVVPCIYKSLYVHFAFQIESALPTLARPIMSLDANEDAILGALKQSLVNFCLIQATNFLILYESIVVIFFLI